MFTKTLAAITVTAALLITAPAITSATTLPRLSCPSGTVPGWLDTQGLPTVCVGDTAGNNPPPETLTRFIWVRPAPKTHVVRRGETLWHIAVMAYGGPTHDTQAGRQYRKIMRLSHLRSTRIHAGQVLRLR